MGRRWDQGAARASLDLDTRTLARIEVALGEILVEVRAVNASLAWLCREMAREHTTRDRDRPAG